MHTYSIKNNAIQPVVPGTENPHKYDMVVFCHLRWDFVYQRPQHIISRLCKTLKILLIEEPWHRPEEKGSRLRQESANLHILQPNVGSIEEIASVLHRYADKAVQAGWFYSAAFIPLLDYFNFNTVVYDCMDELSLFKGASEKIVAQERQLIDTADIIFTGGKSLYESKAQLHGNVYCFPSSVDRGHFSKALNGIALPEDIVTVKGPIVGYFGVIDERIDLDILLATALLLPDINFVMIGPLAKISENDLPRAANIHYPGMKDYSQLPGYLKAFSIAMMPFALNDATKYISPTKTLEYMAAGKPIISTAIHDVVRDYGKVIKIVNTPHTFADAVKHLLSAPVDAGPAYEAILDKTSWDATVEKMTLIIKQAQHV